MKHSFVRQQLFSLISASFTHKTQNRMEGAKLANIAAGRFT